MTPVDHIASIAEMPADHGQALIDQINQQALDLLASDGEKALELIEYAQGQAQAIGYRHGLATGQRLLGKHHYANGDFEQAKHMFMAAMKQCADLGENEAMAECAVDLARLSRDSGDYVTASEHVERSLALCHGFTSSRLLSDALNIKATILHAEGKYQQAIEVLEHVLSLKREQGDLAGQAGVLLNLGITYTDLSNFSVSLEHFSQARKLIKSLENLLLDAQCSLNIGGVYHELGEFEQAHSYYTECLQVSHEGNLANLEVMALTNISDTHYCLGRYEEAALRFQQALEKSRAIGLTHIEVGILDGLGKTYRSLRQFQKALEYHHEALSIAERSGNSRARIEALYGLGCAHLESGDQTSAIALFKAALIFALDAQQLKPAFEAHQRLAEAFEQLGDTANALEHFKAYHALEREVFNLETARKTKNLTLQLDLERVRNEAEVYRMRTEVTEQANAMLEDKVRERTQELEEARVEVVMRLAVAAEYRDDHTGEHTWRVGRTSALIATEMGLPADQVELIRLAARLHDVGKIGISDLIMLKPDRLTPDEFERMKTHTTIGAQILSGGKTPLLLMAESIALSHHEHWNGRGYPLGIAGEGIPLVGRIVAVADVFDALLSERPYKRPWSFQEACEEILAKSGSQFDPLVVAAFTRLLERGIVFDQP